MNVVKGCILAALLAAFFISNAVTGSLGACGGTGNSCHGTCADSGDPNTQNCCFSLTDTGSCDCHGVAAGNTCP
jgi:hypothetical protein